MKLLLLCLPLCITLTVFGQTRKTAVDSIELRYQECLSQGGNSYNCALAYYQEMDSLLSAVYNQVYNNLDNPRRETLEIAQAQWTEKKEAYFKDIEVRAEKKRPLTLAGLDDDMILTDNKAAYLKHRVIELLKSIHS
ncbi:lysozyme inhibitor LprI family protein [Chitinophaga sancti]|uniref:lysozyme inhibitor LprI family protein n=1 Tax=Chitinophaga sancti TaxID=1004 RepID=UPI002A75D29A|nr:lysozyme inhibitor LprI family protein [Chitinophaga sancti]WPQ64199.1 lysozyme inhibitor LprI family protein [Chitinophaga sancti]